ncbi:DUF1015 family protein [Schleiferiaceae bacterium]|nr:DUF1015 family protein [Schleiferiaceae bacterium]
MLRPFKAVRPTRDKAYLVATRSYITYGAEELDDKLENNPYTFLHVINPNALPEANYKDRFKAVRSRYDRFEKEDIFIQELYEKITGKSFNKVNDEGAEERIYANVEQYLATLSE